MSSASDRVSLVLATMGDLDLLRRCLRSVEGQLRPGDEVLLVVAKESAAVRALAAEHGAACLVQEGRGISDARNKGIDAARHPVVAFLDDDCEVLPGWRDGLAAFAAGGLDAASGPVDGPRGNLPMRWGYHAYREPDARAWQLIGCNMAFRRAALAQERFDAAFTYGFDETDVEARMKARGLRVGRMPAPVYHHHRQSWRQLVRQQVRYAPRSVDFRRKHGLRPLVPRKHLLLAAGLLLLLATPWVGAWSLLGLGAWLAGLAYEGRRLGGSWREAIALLPVLAVVALAQAAGLLRGLLRGTRP